jgi:hypothetical protein
VTTGAQVDVLAGGYRTKPILLACVCRSMSAGIALNLFSWHACVGRWVYRPAGIALNLFSWHACVGRWVHRPAGIALNLFSWHACVGRWVYRPAGIALNLFFCMHVSQPMGGWGGVFCIGCYRGATHNGSCAGGPRAIRRTFFSLMWGVTVREQTGSRGCRTGRSGGQSRSPVDHWLHG